MEIQQNDLMNQQIRASFGSSLLQKGQSEVNEELGVISACDMSQSQLENGLSSSGTAQLNKRVH